MIKIVGCLCILLSTTILGFIYGDKFKKRVLEIKELERCIYQLQNEILYTHSTLPNAFYNISLKSKYPLNKIFKEISKLLKCNEVDSVFEAFKKVIYDNKIYLNLNNEDIDILLDLSKSLGESDISGQAKVFKLTIQNCKKQIVSAEEIKNKCMKMYRTLGFCIGAMIVIVLI